MISGPIVFVILRILVAHAELNAQVDMVFATGDVSLLQERLAFEEIPLQEEAKSMPESQSHNALSDLVVSLQAEREGVLEVRAQSEVSKAAAARDGLQLETASQSPLHLMPLARSLTSEDPEAAAEFMVRYHGAKRVSTNFTSGCPSTFWTTGVQLRSPDEVSAAELPSIPVDRYTVYFVKDTQAKAGPLPRNIWETLSDDTYEHMFASGRRDTWTGWMDFHDGMSYGRNVTQLRLDNIHVQPFLGHRHLYRTNMPNSTYAIEFDSAPTDAESFDWLEAQPTEAKYTCRNFSVMGLEPKINLWKKATYSVANERLELAMNQSRDLLGVVPVESPYPPPGSQDSHCQTALWGEIRNDANKAVLEWHIVASSPPDPDFGATRFHEYLGTFRKLESGCFDHFLYNSLILWADSLDPVVKRLQDHHVPFLALKHADQLFSITFSFPGNEAMTYDIRSSLPSFVQHTPFDPCTVGPPHCREE